MVKIILAMLVAAIMTAVYASESIAIIKSVKGTVTIKRSDNYGPAQKGDWLYASDIIQTGDGSSVGLVFNDGTAVSLGAKSMLNIHRFLFVPAQNEYDFDMSLQKGSAAFESGKIGKLAPQKVKVHVPQGLIGIRGTKFIVEAE